MVSLHLDSIPRQRVDQEIQQATSLDPRTVSYNLNTRLTNSRGERDIDTNHAAELKAVKASEDLAANNPGFSATTLRHLQNIVEAAVKYNAVASAGRALLQRDPKEDKAFTGEIEKQRIIEEAKKAAMIQAEKIAAARGQLNANSQKIKEIIGQPTQIALEKTESLQGISQQSGASNFNWQAITQNIDPMGQIAIDIYRHELSKQPASLQA